MRRRGGGEGDEELIFERWRHGFARAAALLTAPTLAVGVVESIAATHKEEVGGGGVRRRGREDAEPERGPVLVWWCWGALEAEALAGRARVAAVVMASRPEAAIARVPTGNEGLDLSI